MNADIPHCLNCERPLPPEGEYCPYCSQKRTTGRIPLSRLLGEFFESTFNLDSKIFRTLGAIFLPGKLSVEYFRGRHQLYYGPVRLFLVMAVVHFAVINDFMKDKLNFGEAGFFFDIRQAYSADLLEEMRQEKDAVRDQFAGEQRALAALDSLTRRLEKGARDSIKLLFTLDNTPAGRTTLLVTQKPTALSDIFFLEYEELLDRYQINGWWLRLANRQMIKLIRAPSDFTRYLLGQFTWMLLTMMPALALTLKLMYLRRRRYFVEHLVFTFHYHAFAFLLMSAALLLNAYFEEAPEWALLAIMIYMFLAMRRFYAQHWLKTFVKFCALCFFYLMTFIFFLIATLAISAVFF
jgi:hypothetical protein